MAKYINYGGNYMPRQPGRSIETAVHLFGVRAELGKLQALCDKTLNARDDNGAPLHPDLEYQVLSEVFLLLFMKMEKFCSDHPADKLKGMAREKELNIAIPLLALERFGPFLVPKRFVWYMPYLWIDSGVCMAAGRETYGFPKAMANIVVPDGIGQTAEFSVKAETWENFNAAQKCEIKTIVDVHRVGGGTVESVELIPHFLSFFTSLIEAFGFPQFPPSFPGSDLFPQMFRDLARFVFLKQFRDHADGDDACYQAVIEAPVSYPAFHSGHWLAGKYEAQFFNYASTPVVAELGLAGVAGNQATQEALFAGLLNFDFVLGNGETKWVAP